MTTIIMDDPSTLNPLNTGPGYIVFFFIFLFAHKTPAFKHAIDAKLFNLNFHPLEVVSRYRDPQLQVGKITHICFIRDEAFANIYF